MNYSTKKSVCIGVRLEEIGLKFELINSHFFRINIYIAVLYVFIYRVKKHVLKKLNVPLIFINEADNIINTNLNYFKNFLDKKFIQITFILKTSVCYMFC